MKLMPHLALSTKQHMLYYKYMFRLVGHTPESLPRLPDESLILAYDLAAELVSEPGDKPFSSKQTIWQVLMRQGIEVPHQIFDTIEPGDSLVCFTADYRYVFAMGDVLNLTSYSFDELSAQLFSDLFETHATSMKLFRAAIQAACSGEAVTPDISWHLLTEKKSHDKLSFEVKVKCLSYFKATSGLTGFIASLSSRQSQYRQAF